ncbi:MAG TPA: ComF family protein [Gemmatimonadales bacterium]|nr:ComF family protein [Gemmatimonadales bacterium]
MPSWADLRTLAQGVERLLLPGECLLCRATLAAREWEALVCALCRLRWRAVPAPWCDRCGQPVLPDLGCRFCAAWDESLSRVRSAVWLDGSARDAVHHLKYDGWRGVAPALAAPMRRLEPLEPGAVLVPIPLGRARRRSRGYNQAEELARALGRVTGLAVRPDLLRRARETRSQTALAPTARAANVQGAFMASGGRGARLVLVDDVCTTGATLVAAARALRSAGAGRVEAVTFARAPLPVPGGM